MPSIQSFEQADQEVNVEKGANLVQVINSDMTAELTQKAMETSLQPLVQRKYSKVLLTLVPVNWKYPNFHFFRWQCLTLCYLSFRFQAHNGSQVL